jgi:archaellum component FlaC
VAENKHEPCYLEPRLSKIEWDLNEQKQDLEDVQHSATTLHDNLNEIKTCLQQIKFTAYGVVGMGMLSVMGIKDFLGVFK